MAELDSKIEEYRSQLDQINSLLSEDETNEEYISLKNNLQHVISLTENLIKYQDEKHVESYAVGDRVEVITGDRPYAGVVMQVIGDSECVVKYFEYSTEVVLPLTSMRKISTGYYNDSQVAPGLKCQCKYGVDQKWYDCTIEAATEYGYSVTYTEYGNKEEVPIEYLRPFSERKDKSKATSGSTVAGAGPLISIPENLKILPTDTEEEKLRKKKKIKAIKSRNRLQTKEQEISATQNTWKSFISKAEKKSSKTLAVAPIVPKTSMFASPDETDGKVGVIRSGHGMTEFAQRKRHKFVE